jgi:hypothetical protein
VQYTTHAHIQKRWTVLLIAAGATITLGYSPPSSYLKASLWLLRTVTIACVFKVFCDPEDDDSEAFEDSKGVTSNPKETIARLQALVAQLQQQHSQQKTELLRALHEDRTALATQSSQLQQQWQRMEAQALHLETQKRQLQLERGRLQEWAEEQSQQIQKLQTEAQVAIESRQKQIEERLLAERERIIEKLQQEWEALQEKATGEITARDKVIADLQQRLKDLTLLAHTLQKPDLTEGMSEEELLADRVIRFLYENGVIVKNPQVKPLGGAKFELKFEVLSIAPGAQEKNQYATSLLDAYKRISDKLVDGIPGVVPGCKTRPTTDISNQRITLKIDTSGVDWAAQARAAQKPQIVEAGVDWLLELVSYGNHFRITGPTDSGKSTLADNLVGALRLEFSALGLTTADPKYPFTEWTTFTPQYKGIHECFAGVFKLEKLITSRFAKARLNADSGQPLPEFEPELFALDEAEILMDEARAIDDANPPKRGEVKLQKKLTRALRKGLKLGRGLTKKRGKGLKVLYIAQSPLCMRLGFHRDDFDQSVNLFIGENIPRALLEELKGKITSAQRDFWLEQYHLRLERGDQYFCLVKVPASAGKQSLFIATMPAPGAYKPEGINLTDLAEPEDLKDFDVLKYLAEAEFVVDDDEEDDLAEEEEEGHQGRSPAQADLERLEAEFAMSSPDLSTLSLQALELLRYVFAQGSHYAVEGWFSVAKLRDGWARNRQINAEGLKTLLREINALGAGEFQAGGEREWRPTISSEFLPPTN